MTCNEIREWIPAVSRRQIGLTEWALVEAHLRQCADCGAEMERADAERRGVPTRTLTGLSGHLGAAASGLARLPGRLLLLLLIPLARAVGAVGALLRASGRGLAHLARLPRRLGLLVVTLLARAAAAIAAAARASGRLVIGLGAALGRLVTGLGAALAYRLAAAAGALVALLRAAGRGLVQLAGLPRRLGSLLVAPISGSATAIATGLRASSHLVIRRGAAAGRLVIGLGAVLPHLLSTGAAALASLLGAIARGLAYLAGLPHRLGSVLANPLTRVAAAIAAGARIAGRLVIGLGGALMRLLSVAPGALIGIWQASVRGLAKLAQLPRRVHPLPPIPIAHLGTGAARRLTGAAAGMLDGWRRGLGLLATLPGRLRPQPGILRRWAPRGAGIAVVAVLALFTLRHGLDLPQLVSPEWSIALDPSHAGETGPADGPTGPRPVHVVGRLSVKDRSTSERDLTALLARSGGTQLGRQQDPAVTVVEAVVPSSGYREFTHGLAQIGSWQVEAERRPLPKGVRMMIRVAE